MEPEPAPEPAPESTPQGREPEGFDGGVFYYYFNIMYAIVQHIAANLPHYIAMVGWPLLITLVILYNIWPYVQQLRESASLAAANAPSRKELFNNELKRARAIQQLDVYKASREKSEGVGSSRAVDAAGAPEEEDLGQGEDEGDSDSDA